MFNMKLKVTPKSMKMKSGAAMSMKIIAMKAMKYLRNRIVNQNKDLMGRPLPPLSGGRNFFYFSPKDPRFKHLYKSGVADPAIAFVTSDYGQVKTLIGARNKRDGDLTGAMWNSLTPQVKKLGRGAGGGMALRLYFARSSVTAEAKTRRRNPRTGRSELVWTKARVRNRTKAFYMQVLRKGGNPVFQLMGFNSTEMRIFTKIILEGLKVNGQKLGRAK